MLRSPFKPFHLLSAGLLLASSLAGQTLSNASLAGKYFFRQLLVKTDNNANVIDLRSLQGTIAFSGTGTYTYTGQQAVGAGAPTTIAGGGNYTVDQAGVVTMTNPQNNALNLNARFGTEAVVGSTTEATDNTFDLFAAIPAPTTPVSAASLNGQYFGTDLEFPNSSGPAVRSGLFPFQPNGAGTIPTFTVNGHSQTVNSGAPTTQDISGASYTLASDGTGTLTFPGGGNLVGGTKTIAVSADGNVILGGNNTAGSPDFFVAIKSFSGNADSTSWNGRFWAAGLRFDPGFNAESYAGSLNANPSLGNVTVTRRGRQAGYPNPYVFTGVNGASIGANALGNEDINTVALGAGGNLFITTENSSVDPNSYDLELGVRQPAISGTGLYLNPLAVLNGASFAPAVNPVSPGEYVTLFVAGLPAQTVAGSLPYPKTLGGVGVTVNGTAAPISFVNPSQINVLIPYGTTGTTATFVVTSGGKTSNAVTVPLAVTTPGIFSQDGSGTGLGAITHADFSLVTPSSPAKRGETVVVFLTGLGQVTNAPPDGSPALGSPLSMTVAQPEVFVGDTIGVVSFSGLAPGFPGLYQINVTVPTNVTINGSTVPLAIQTGDAFNDMIDLPVQ